MIYLNHAATSYPKSPEVVEAVVEALRSGENSSNRGSVESVPVARKIFELREAVSGLIGAKEPHSIILTPSATVALNTVIFGVDGDENSQILISDMEHNSVARPAFRFQEDKKAKRLATFDAHSIDDLERKIDAIGSENIPCVILSHASNVTGDVYDAERIGTLLKEKNVPFVLDVSQTIGLADIDVDKWHVSALAFAGHKALGGPQGTGGLYVRRGFPLKPLFYGGTGNASSEIDPPVVFPDSFEAGTPPTHDHLGLLAAISALKEIGLEKYRSRILRLAQTLSDRLREIPGVTVYGEAAKRTGTIAFNVAGVDPSVVGERLAERWIVCRTGIHCAALAKEKLGGPTVRFSCGYTNTESDIKAAISAVKKIAEMGRG